MHPTVKAARIAGAIYASMVVTGPFSLIYVPNKLIVRGDAAATADNILAHETMFRLSILADLVGQVIFICLAIALYRLLSSVNKIWAALMEMFWGLWLFPFGLLVFRSGFLPRIIGVWLMINCFGYVVLSVIALFFHEYYGPAFNWLQPILFGELAIMLWLLIKGAKVPVATTTAAAA